MCRIWNPNPRTVEENLALHPHRVASPLDRAALDVLTERAAYESRDVAAALRAPRARAVEPTWKATALFEPADDGALPGFDLGGLTHDGRIL
jgi:hypothetical protein